MSTRLHRLPQWLPLQNTRSDCEANEAPRRTQESHGLRAGRVRRVARVDHGFAAREIRPLTGPESRREFAPPNHGVLIKLVRQDLRRVATRLHRCLLPKTLETGRWCGRQKIKKQKKLAGGWRRPRHPLAPGRKTRAGSAPRRVASVIVS